MDEGVLEMLGPFARALHLIFEYVEFQRADCLECGNFALKRNPSTEPLGTFSRSFLLFRGVKMSEEQLTEWCQCIGKCEVSEIQLNIDCEGELSRKREGPPIQRGWKQMLRQRGKH